MLTLKAAYIGLLLLLLGIALVSCSGNSSSKLGISDSGLAPCPSSPNCVSSDSQDNAHHVKPFQLTVPPEEAWHAVRKLVSKLPRTQIVSERPDYIHAECRSAVFGFVDDLEMNLRPAQGIIAVRSASRLGYSDFGVNRRRIETLRSSLARQGIVR